MHPKLTHFARFILDELLPPIIRDQPFIMYPLFYLWFRGDRKLIHEVMSFKEHAPNMSEEEFLHSYEQFRNLGSHRYTDAFDEDHTWVLERIDRRHTTLLDVGCGSGYWLDLCHKMPNLHHFQLSGLDIYPTAQIPCGTYFTGNLEHLPFEDKSFDVVTCFYVLEHIRNFEKAISELKRITRHQLFIAVPLQRAYLNTFDLHLHFFYSAAYFRSRMRIEHSECALIGPKRVENILFYGKMS